jgi:hypothetical protein
MNMVKYGRELFEVSDSKLGQVLNTDFDELRKLANRNVDLSDGELGLVVVPRMMTGKAADLLQRAVLLSILQDLQLLTRRRSWMRER